MSKEVYVKENDINVHDVQNLLENFQIINFFDIILEVSKFVNLSIVQTLKSRLFFK